MLSIINIDITVEIVMRHVFIIIVIIILVNIIIIITFFIISNCVVLSVIYVVHALLTIVIDKNHTAQFKCYTRFVRSMIADPHRMAAFAVSDCFASHIAIELSGFMLPQWKSV